MIRQNPAKSAVEPLHCNKDSCHPFVGLETSTPVKCRCSAWPVTFRTANPGCSVTRHPMPTRATEMVTARGEPSGHGTSRKPASADSTWKCQEIGASASFPEYLPQVLLQHAC